MAYKYDDFSACAFNPMAKEKMIVKYPRLYSLIENETWDIKEHNIDALIRYIIAASPPCYTQNFSHILTHGCRPCNTFCAGCRPFHAERVSVFLYKKQNLLL